MADTQAQGMEPELTGAGAGAAGAEFSFGDAERTQNLRRVSIMLVG